MCGCAVRYSDILPVFQDTRHARRDDRHAMTTRPATDRKPATETPAGHAAPHVPVTRIPTRQSGQAMAVGCVTLCRIPTVSP